MKSIVKLHLLCLVIVPPIVLCLGAHGLGVQYLKAISGKSASIPCQASDWDENEVLLVLWYREDSAVPFYKLDSRHRQLSKAKHILVSTDLSNRFFFDVSTHPPVLRVNPVLITDEGVYRCRVDYKSKRTQTVNVFMEVFGPPKEVIITYDGQSVEGLIGPFDEFSYVTLICEARAGMKALEILIIERPVAGNPNPSVIWFQTGVLEVVIDSTYAVNSTGIVRNELTLRRLDRQDYRSKLTCRASSSGLYDPIDKSVIIDLNLKPLSVEIMTNNTPLLAGVLAQFRCASHGSRPAASIVWSIGEQTLEDVETEVIDEGNATHSLVTFKPTIAHNNQFLVCRAFNDRLSDSSVEAKVVLIVEYEPKIDISFDTNFEKKELIKEGDYVRLICKVMANPEVESIQWAFDGKQVTNLALLDGNQTLVIKNINKTNDGKYQCTARNAIGATISDVLMLEVNYAPICRKGQQIYYNVVRNLVNRVHCSVSARPENPNLRFKWFVNTSIEMFELKTFASSDDEPTTSVAHYTPKSLANFAMVLCLAENNVGVQREPCIFYLRIQNGPPEPVRHCDISNKSQTIISVECKSGNSGGLDQTFHLEVYRTDSEELHSNYSSSQPNFIVDGLSSDTLYHFIVYSSNKKGKSVGLTYHSIRLPIVEVSQRELKPLLNSFIGIVASIVIVCVVVVLVIRIRAYIYEDEYSVQDKYDPDKRNSQDSDDIDEMDRGNLMPAGTSEQKDIKDRFHTLKRLTNRLKATKAKTFEVTGLGKYTKVPDNEPNKKTVTFATLDEFSIDEPIDEQSYDERPVDVEPSNSKEIQTDPDHCDDTAIDTSAEVSQQEDHQSGDAQVEPPRKLSRKESSRRSKYLKRSFFRNSFRKTL